MRDADCSNSLLVIILRLLADGITLDTKPLLSGPSAFLCIIERGFHLEGLRLCARAWLVSARQLRELRVLCFLHRILCALDPVSLAVGVYFLHQLLLTELILIGDRQGDLLSLVVVPLGFERWPLRYLLLDGTLDRDEPIQVQRLRE